MQQARFHFIQSIRDFFNNNNFLQIDVPPIVENPGMEVHIRPFQLGDKYLHTSPEFFMKEVLATSNIKKSYNLSYSFRDEPHSDIHRKQFLMLEWYRVDSQLNDIIEDVKNLLTFLAQKYELPESLRASRLEVMSINEVFKKFTGISILDFIEFKQIKDLVHQKFPELVPTDETNLQWDDYFFLIFLNYIEPKLVEFPLLILKDYPAPLAALSEIEDKISKRFEFFINGVEIANCFQECTNKDELQARFEAQNQLKEKLYGYKLPEARRFLRAMESFPPSSGIALGVERLMKALTDFQPIFLD